LAKCIKSEFSGYKLRFQADNPGIPYSTTDLYFPENMDYTFACGNYYEDLDKEGNSEDLNVPILA
jgi:hypothetical protein